MVSTSKKVVLQKVELLICFVRLKVKVNLIKAFNHLNHLKAIYNPVKGWDLFFLLANNCTNNNAYSISQSFLQLNVTYKSFMFVVYFFQQTGARPPISLVEMLFLALFLSKLTYPPPESDTEIDRSEYVFNSNKFGSSGIWTGGPPYCWFCSTTGDTQGLNLSCWNLNFLVGSTL